MMNQSRWRAPLLGAVAITAMVFAPASWSTDSEKALLEIDPKNFDRPTVIDNKWMPLKPGTQFVYDGFDVEDGEVIPHSVVFTVTDLVKVINGIPTVVVWDRDFTEGRLEESELTFFAQDNDGNVWHLGQYRETYDEIEFVGGRAWMVGHLDGARAGIMMKANPVAGTPSYSQGYAPPPFHWTDRARVREVGAKTKVAAGEYENVLITEEFNDEEPGAIQLKYYAPGVGNVQVGWEGDDKIQEEMELIRVVELGPEEMEKVRTEALKLEDRNYVYGRTQPIER